MTASDIRTDASPADDLAQLVTDRAAAVRRGDVDALTAQYASDVTVFDVLPPLRFTGYRAEHEKLTAWFAGYRSGVGYDVRELRVHADGDIGFAFYIFHVSGTLQDGDQVDMWVRATLGCQRVGERWLIVHDHSSVPFDASTGQALTTLAPEETSRCLETTTQRGGW